MNQYISELIGQSIMASNKVTVCFLEINDQRVLDASENLVKQG